MKISTGDFTRIQNLIRAKTGYNPSNLRHWNGAIHFTTQAGEEKTRAACKHLLDHGLQSTPDDGKSEFTMNFTDGADRVDVIWTIDPLKPLWNE